MKLSDSGMLLAFTVLAAALPAFAAKLTDKEHTRIEEPRPADVPSDSELEAAGAVIGKIDTGTSTPRASSRKPSGYYACSATFMTPGSCPSVMPTARSISR